MALNGISLVSKSQTLLRSFKPSLLSTRLDRGEVDWFYSLDETVDSVTSLFQRPLEWRERVNSINAIFSRVRASHAEIQQHASFDPQVAYTRNLLIKRPRFTLLLLCWNPGAESKIHNHPCDGCFVKVLEGQLVETRYRLVKERGEELLQVVDSRLCREGSRTSLTDDINIHKVMYHCFLYEVCSGIVLLTVLKIGNPSFKEGAVSLHLYTPPFESFKVREIYVYSAYISIILLLSPFSSV